MIDKEDIKIVLEYVDVRCRLTLMMATSTIDHCKKNYQELMKRRLQLESILDEKNLIDITKL